MRAQSPLVSKTVTASRKKILPTTPQDVDGQVRRFSVSTLTHICASASAALADNMINTRNSVCVRIDSPPHKL